MHGLIFSELKKFAESALGKEAWPKLLKDAGLEYRSYVTGEAYPDAEVVALVSAASKRANRPVPALLEDFGEFIVPDLVAVYGPFIKPRWRTLDLLEHTEESIHKAVRLRDPGALPPELKCTRVSPKEVRILYSSGRRMCGVAKGIIRGVAKHYRESIALSESTCMLRGDAVCTLTVRLA